MELLYDKFDLGLDGFPTPWWQARNLLKWKSPFPLEHAFFPDSYLQRVWVNRRMAGPLWQAYAEIAARWTREARAAYGLNQFVKCYCFGEGSKPNLHWYGAAWELSSQVGGEILAEVVKVFTRHGFTHAHTSDKHKLRTFELW